MDYHKSLDRQIKKYLGTVDDLPEELLQFISSINETYKTHDVDRKLLERSINISSEEFLEINKTLKEQQKRLESYNYELKQFAFIAAHDLKEPLRSISGFIQLTLRGMPENFDHKKLEYLNIAVKNVNRLNELLDSLMIYSNIHDHHEVEYKNVCIRELLSEVELLLNTKINETKTEIVVNAKHEIVCDKFMLIKLLQNLIENAIKFQDASQTPQITIDSKQNNANVIISISDNGIGIESSYREKVFELFNRVYSKDVYEGSGMGLAISKKIVESHGGTIWVDNEYSPGTRFNFTIPSTAILKD